MAPSPVGTGPSPPTTGAGTELVLIRQDGELTVFAPGGGGGDVRAWKGITCKVSGGLLAVGDVAFGCAPA